MRVWWIKPLEKKNQNQLFYRTNKAVGLMNQAPTEEKPYKKRGLFPFLDIEDTKQKVGLMNQTPTEEKP